MSRRLLLSAIAFAAVLVADAQTIEARRLFSVRNPYTSFNISGINYGSMNWEREHGSRASGYQSGRRVLLHRR